MSKTIYSPATIEPKWQQFWEELKLFQNTTELSKGDKEKLYLLFAFAYPSGSGLHVGHVESKTALDILARFNRMNGKDVFFPVGWDAFGLPAENYAIKTGVPPAQTTIEAIKNFRRQIRRVGISYDWESEVATCEPNYYRWTQWLFLQLFNKGLAYQKTAPVNWCPSCQTVLANEQVVAGVCERCGTKVIQKDMKQWFFKITEYKDELISGLDKVDWPNSTREHQLNWIGKKEGINIHYPVNGVDEEVICFSTRPETNFGATFVVLAPEHKLVSVMLEPDNKWPIEPEIKNKIRAYLEAAKAKTELQRQTEGKDKSGVFTGLTVLNRLTGEEMPLWISDYVLPGFGTGAVVGVPAHDKRDFEFASKFNLPIKRVIKSPLVDASEITKITQIYEGDGEMVNSGFLNGMDSVVAFKTVCNHLEDKGWGKKIVNYRLRDWLISRQRYWGAPIPIVYDPQGNPHPVKEEHLPWLLPEDVDFKPTGESPLTTSKEFISRVEKLYGEGWRPEFDTMDTFVDSSWYFIRYIDAKNGEKLADQQKISAWLPVDFYMIGPEHAVLHLLYARFFAKFLRDQGYLKIDEPFIKMRHQGMVLGPDGKKMSKSKGNVINPDEVIEKFGADTLRVYEMFMGPIDADKAWDTRAVAGVYRFLQRCYDLVDGVDGQNPDNKDLARQLHRTIKKVTQDTANSKFNTAISSLMEFTNSWLEVKSRGQVELSQESVFMFVKLLAPYAPFMAEELAQRFIGEENVQSIHLATWPKWDEAMCQSDVLKIPVQIAGKVRATLEVEATKATDESYIYDLAINNETIAKWLENKKVARKVYIPGKIISLVLE